MQPQHYTSPSTTTSSNKATTSIYQTL